LAPAIGAFFYSNRKEVAAPARTITPHRKEITMHDPSEVIYAVTMQDILTAIERRLGAESSTLSEEDIHLACEEFHAAVEHYVDECLSMSIDSWLIVRDL
jgi:hypothetical protein